MNESGLWPPTLIHEPSILGPSHEPLAACIARSLICCFSAGTSLRGLPFCSLSRRSNPWLGKLQGAKRKKLGHRPSEPQPTQTLTLVLVHNPLKPHSAFITPARIQTNHSNPLNQSHSNPTQTTTPTSPHSNPTPPYSALNHSVRRF